MTDLPAPKRVKLSDESSTPAATVPDEDLLDKYFDELDQVQEAIENNIDEEAAKILELQKQYSAKRKPLFEARSRIISLVPGFWLKAVRPNFCSDVLFLELFGFSNVKRY